MSSAKKVKPGTSKQAADDRKKAFAEAYIANERNGKQAAITAGFSPRTAESQASRLLKDVKVQQIIRERQNELAKKHELTTESIIAELAKIVHSDPRKLFDEHGALLPVHLWPDDMAAAVASVEVFEEFVGQGADRVSIGYTKKLKLWDKNPAIDKAMKHLGLFEQDNKQKVDPIAELLKQIGGSLPVKP